MNLSEVNPAEVMMLGDPHANTYFLINRAQRFRDRHPGDETLYMIACGDVEFYLSHDWTWWAKPVSDYLKRINVVLLAVDGNHEHHKILISLQSTHGCVPIETLPNIYWLPRGYRWEWQGNKWLACGGAHSIDRVHRTENVSWFEEEEITPAQKHNICQAGKTDVIVTHDCPIGVTLSLPDPKAYGWAYEDVHASSLHRVTLQEIFDVTQPSKMFGGHFHMGVNKMVEMGYGPVEITILDWSGAMKYNTAIVDTKSLEIVEAF